MGDVGNRLSKRRKKRGPKTTSGPTFRRARRFPEVGLAYLPFFLFFTMSSGDIFGSGGFSLLMLFAAMSISIF